MKGGAPLPTDEATSSNSAPDISATETSQPSSTARATDSSTPLAANGKALGWSFLPQEDPEQAEEPTPSSVAQEDGVLYHPYFHHTHCWGVVCTVNHGTLEGH